MDPYDTGYKAGILSCNMEPGLILAFRMRRAKEAATMFAHLGGVDREQFIDGFLAGYSQRQTEKDQGE